MKRACVAALLLAGCGEGGEGQKVTVLLSDRTVTCEDVEGRSVAHLQLDQAEDLYQAEFVNPQTGAVRTLEGLRDDLIVSFDCPDGVDSFAVRHATVLQARAEAELDQGAEAPADGGATPP
jgi:hypothetical protein